MFRSEKNLYESKVVKNIVIYLSYTLFIHLYNSSLKTVIRLKLPFSSTQAVTDRDEIFWCCDPGSPLDDPQHHYVYPFH